MEAKPEPSTPIDLVKFSKAYRIESRESPMEIQARLKREEGEAAHQRSKDWVILCAVLIVVDVVAVICSLVVVLPGSAPESVKWATTLLTTIVSAGIGYMTGKGSK